MATPNHRMPLIRSLFHSQAYLTISPIVLRAGLFTACFNSSGPEYWSTPFAAYNWIEQIWRTYLEPFGVPRNANFAASAEEADEYCKRRDKNQRRGSGNQNASFHRRRLFVRPKHSPDTKEELLSGGRPAACSAALLS